MFVLNITSTVCGKSNIHQINYCWTNSKKTTTIAEVHCIRETKTLKRKVHYCWVIFSLMKKNNGSEGTLHQRNKNFKGKSEARRPVKDSSYSWRAHMDVIWAGFRGKIHSLFKAIISDANVYSLTVHFLIFFSEDLLISGPTRCLYECLGWSSSVFL